MLKFINKNKKLTAAVCTVGILFSLGVGMTGCAPSFKRIANPSFFKEVSRVKYPSVESDFYVSVDGDDSASGSIDQPFATIKRAQEAVREYTAEYGIPSGGMRVGIKNGYYPMQNISFSAEDSGKIDSPIIYSGYGDGETVLSGGIKLNTADFQDVTGEERARLQAKAADKVKYVNLSDYGITQEDYGKMHAIGRYHNEGKYTDASIGNSAELYVSGVRQTPARYPNDKDLKTGKIIDIGDAYEPSPGDYRESWHDLMNPRGGTFRVGSAVAKRIANWRSLEDVWMYGYFYWDWADMSTPIANYDAKKKEITTKYCSRYGFKKDTPYYFYNVFEELDTQGEWYLDRTSGRLYIYADENFSGSDIELSLTQAPIIDTDNVENIVFENLTIACGRESGINIQGNDNVIRGCKIRDVSTAGVKISGYNNLVFENEISHTGQDGIILSGGDRETLKKGNNKADNNYIHHFARLYRTYSGGVSVYGVGNTVSHNEISQAPHLAVFYEGNEHLIEYNRIYNVVLDSDDAGAIYAKRSSDFYGNTIRYNCIYDIGSGKFKPHGIYFDDMLSGQTAYGNVLVNIPGNGFLIGGGRDNNVNDNLIINASKPIVYDQRGYDGLHNNGWYAVNVKNSDSRFWKNVESAKLLNKKWNNAYPLISALHSDFNRADEANFALNPANSTLSGNVVVSKKGKIGEISDAVLRYSKVHNNGTYKLKDIGFINYSGGDYRFKSSIGYHGVENIPFDKIGRYN